MNTSVNLKQFINENIIINNTYNIFNYEQLKTRIITTQGGRTMRHDMTNGEIIAAAQNVVDINKGLLSALFEYGNQFNPDKLTSKIETVSGTNEKERNETRENTGTSNNSQTTTNTGDVTGETTAENKPDLTTQTYRNAYNAPETKPADTTKSIGTDTTTTNTTTTNDLTQEITAQNRVTNNDTINGNDNTTYSETRNTRGISSVSEYYEAYEKYIQPFDFLINLITKEICELIW